MITADFKIFNDFEDFIFVTKKNGEILYSNTSAVRFFGKLKNFSKIKNYFSIDSTACINSERFDLTIIDLLFESKNSLATF